MGIRKSLNSHQHTEIETIYTKITEDILEIVPLAIFRNIIKREKKVTVNVL